MHIIKVKCNEMHAHQIFSSIYCIFDYRVREMKCIEASLACVWLENAIQCQQMQIYFPLRFLVFLLSWAFERTQSLHISYVHVLSAIGS